MPSLTVRAFAELLELPAHRQARILTEQKYPKQGPQSFKAPYYQQALTGIRAFFRAGNDMSQLALAAARIEGFRQESKRDNNLRVLNGFRSSELAARRLALGPARRVRVEAHDVQLRFSPDLAGQIDRAERFILLHCRAGPLNPELARTTLELSHWVLERAGQVPPLDQLEYIDLQGGNSYSISGRRVETIEAAEQALVQIKEIWEEI